MNFEDRLAHDLELPQPAVAATVALLGEGASVPFIARYRKERTGGLDEVQIRAIEERHGYLRELEARRRTVLEAVEAQGALTPDRRRAIEAATTKSELEDLYLPFKKKRRTRAQKARERGLAALAERILAQPRGGDPRGEARAFVDAAQGPAQGIGDEDEALAGARDIVAESVSERADVRASARGAYRAGWITVARARGAKAERTKFEHYYDHRERARDIPSHRYLAIRRGEEEGVLRVRVAVDDEGLLADIERRAGRRADSPFSGELRAAIRDALRRLIAPSVESEVRAELKERSDRAAVAVFADNLRHVLLAAPLGEVRVVGVDPGLRTGCKCAAVTETGQYVGSTTFFLPGANARAKARAERGAHELVDFVRAHRPRAVAVGDGTGGRDAEDFARRALADAGLSDVIVASVSEAGASVYSASEVAREEFPDLDITVRGAISIARRLQDPLAELVKIDPHAIGVGQYQHDVHQPLLRQKLAEVVEDCVGQVGVSLNTASASLLSYVAGVGPRLAQRIVAHRNERGSFRSRRELFAVPGLGPRAFEQAAGFLRIRGGENPIDASAVHPERYPLVERIAADLDVTVAELVGGAELARRIDPARYAGDDVGELTLRDIVSELEKPGRDPRESFSPPRFRDDVRELEDLRPGMQLEGAVTNVTAFGAFVDVGVHQDGLVHISKLADRFVRDPADIVKVGQKIDVRVLEVDLERRRISLSARSEEAAPHGASEGGQKARRAGSGSFKNEPFADLKKR